MRLSGMLRFKMLSAKGTPNTIYEISYIRKTRYGLIEAKVTIWEMEGDAQPACLNRIKIAILILLTLSYISSISIDY